MKLGMSMFWRVSVLQLLFALVLSIGLKSTPLFADVTYVKWKPTFMFACYAVALIIWCALTSNGPIHLLWGKRLNQPPSFWRAFTFSLAGLCGALSLLNLFVAYFATTESWVHFKMFTPIPAELLFCIVTAPYLAARSTKPHP